MTEERDHSARHASAVDEVIAKYLQAAEAGHLGDEQEWLARYPQFATGLAEFFAARNDLNKWVCPPEPTPMEPYLPTTEDFPEAAEPHSRRDPVRLKPMTASREMIGKGTLLANRYQIFAVKAGGMGRVYLAVDLEEEPGRHFRVYRVALKTVADFAEWREIRQARGREADQAIYADIVKRFRREAMAWIRLGKHANIVHALVVIEIGAKPYLLMEYADSGSLASWIEAGRLSVPLAVNFAMQFCEGMKHAARVAGIVHRDIKPQNVLIHHDRILKIADFGLAKAFASDFPNAREQGQGTDPSLSLAGGGTPAYMSPEQWESLAKADVRSDVFSFGAMLYEMVTYERPFAFTRSYERALLGESLPLAHSISPNVPAPLSSIIARCVAYDPEDRYPCFEELVDDLARVNQALPERLPIREEPQRGVEEFSEPAVRFEQEIFSLISLGEYEQAVRRAEQAIETDPNDHDHWNNKGKALGELKRYEEARECFACATRLAPEEAIGWSNLAFAEMFVGNARAGVEAATKAISLDSRFVDGWHARGCCEKRLGRFAEGTASLTRATELAPHDWRIWANLGMCLEQLHQHDEAIQCLERAAKINPDDTSIQHQIALIRASQRRF